MSIDARAEERQEAVRGRVKEKPEIEIDPSLPTAPSKFPLVPAIIATVVLLGGIVGLIAYRQSRPPEIPAEQRARVEAWEQRQKEWAATWDVEVLPRLWFECRHLDEVVRRPCNPTVIASKLAFEQAMQALVQQDAQKACREATLEFLSSRLEARCD